MDFSELILKRQSVRRYDSRSVSERDLNIILEAGRLAPSACNSQPWHIIVVNETKIHKQIAKATYDGALKFNKFTKDSSVILVIVMEQPKIITQIGGRIKNKEYPLYDIGILAEHICLQATELGIGSCMLGWFKEKKVKELLNVPDAKSIGLLISLGYPVTDYRLRTKFRKPFKNIISYNKY